MRRTSRRTFGKQLAGTIVTLPLASLANTAAGQTKETTKSGKDAQRYHENTPPPLSIEDGSLSFLIRTKDAAEPLTEGGSGNKYTYEGNIFGSGKNKIQHIRVLHGSGKLLYEDLHAEDSTITVEVQEVSAKKIGLIELAGRLNKVVLTSTSFETGKAKLKYLAPGMATKKHRYSHEGSGGADDFRISTITVKTKDGSSQSFSAPDEKPEVPFSQEYRILVWFS